MRDVFLCVIEPECGRSLLHTLGAGAFFRCTRRVFSCFMLRRGFCGGLMLRRGFCGGLLLNGDAQTHIDGLERRKR